MRELTPTEFQELTSNDSRFLLFCCGTDCTKCRMQEPELNRIEGMSEIPFYKINAQEETRAADRFEVTVLPTIIKMYGSEEQARIEGEVQNGDYILDHFDIREDVKIQKPSE